MEANNFEKKINQLWSGIVTNIDFHLITHSIHLNVNVITHGVQSAHEILFKGVSSHIFINEFVELDDEKWDYIELTSIVYLGREKRKKYCEEQTKDLQNPLNCYPNIEIEFWNSILLIEARTAVIDGTEFNLIDLN